MAPIIALTGGYLAIETMQRIDRAVERRRGQR
jgi:hypothetical protein